MLKHAYMVFAAVTLLWAGHAVAAGTYVNTVVPFVWVDATGHTKVGPVTGGVYSPLYKFQSATGGCGTAPPTLDDTLSDQIPLGFNFAFGSQTFDSLRIMSNGRVQLTRTAAPALDNATCGFGSPVTQLPFPDPGLNNTLRIYGNDLDPTLSGEVAGYSTLCTNRATCFVSFASLGVTPNRRFVVTWSNVPEWTNTSTTGGNYNLQIILQENGQFIYQFGTDVAGPAAATAQVGWQISTTDFDVPQVGFPAANSAIKFFIPTPVAEYRMEQASWSGAGQVLDTSGNARHATALGGAQTVAAGAVCRGANIPVNSSAAQFDAIDTGIAVPTTVGGVGTITFWYKANTAWSGGGAQDAQLLDATVVNNQWFFLVRRGNGQLRFVITDSTGTVQVAQAAAIAVAAGTWKHIAVSWNFNALAAANSDHMLIYVDGALQVTSSFTTAGSLSAQIGTLYIGDNRSSFTGSNGTGRSTDGVIDEFRIYNYEGGVGLVQRDMNATFSCAAINNFLVNVGAAAGSTCSPKNITITARDVANTTLTTYTGTATISTSAGHGDWAIVGATGVLNNGAADDGAATYTFAAGDNGVVTLSLTDTHADDTTISAADSGLPATLSTSGSINFRDNAFVITPDAIQVAGRDQATSVALWKKDLTTGNCSINTAYTGAKSLDAWITRDALDPGGAAPTIGALSLPSAAPASNPASNNLTTLVFANGAANFNISTTDVGKYALNIRDDTRIFATAVDISGTSNSITTRPFGLAIRGANAATPVQHGTTAASPVFAKAGANFAATVGSYLWAAADDANNDGVPDANADITNNGLTPSFAWAVTVAAGASLPGVTGSINNGSVAQASFSGGAATVANLQYTEVGNIILSAAASNYLNSGVTVSGDSGADGTGAAGGYVGRFTPDHFTVSAGSITNRTAASCAPASSFSYMGESMTLTYSLTAQNVTGGTTLNYSGAYSKLVLTTPASFNFGAKSGVTNLTARVNTPTSAGVWTNGAASVTATIAIARAATPDGPYTAVQLGIAPADSDAVAMGAFNLDVDGVGGNDHANVGVSTEVRFGRLRLQNANGSQLIAMPIPISAQHWNGSGFVTNTLDNCTTIAANNVAIGNPQPAGFAVGAATVGGAFAAGVGTLRLPASGAGTRGSVDVSVNLTGAAAGASCTAGMPASTGAGRTYLQGLWCTPPGTYASDPTARATFGAYRNSDRFIYQQENY